VFRFNILNIIHLTIIVTAACVIGTAAGYDTITTLFVSIASAFLGIGSYVGGLMDERLRLRE
jgi:hypothetical protein